MNRIETKILNCSAVSEAEKTMVFCSQADTARASDPQHGRSGPTVQSVLYY